MTDIDYTRVHAAERLVGDQLEAERLERIRAREIATRRWRLRGWKTGEKNPVFDVTVIGDRNLNDALAGLERDTFIRRTAASLI